MGPVYLIICSLLGAAAVAGLIIVAFDRMSKRPDSTRGDIQPPGGHPKAPAKTADAAVSVRLVASPGRQCLLAWNPDSEEDAGATCSCMRDEVILWSLPLSCPVFIAVTDGGCALLLEREKGSSKSKLRLVDVAGIVRHEESLASEPLEWGTADGGRYAWCVVDRVKSETAQPATFLLLSVDDSVPVLRGDDPREEHLDMAGPITGVRVKDGVATVVVDSGASAELAFTDGDVLPVKPTRQRLDKQ